MVLVNSLLEMLFKVFKLKELANIASFYLMKLISGKRKNSYSSFSNNHKEISNMDKKSLQSISDNTIILRYETNI